MVLHYVLALTSFALTMWGFVETGWLRPRVRKFSSAVGRSVRIHYRRQSAPKHAVEAFRPQIAPSCAPRPIWAASWL